jgi:hypothetical protein
VDFNGHLMLEKVLCTLLHEGQADQQNDVFLLLKNKQKNVELWIIVAFFYHNKTQVDANKIKTRSERCILAVEHVPIYLF